MLVLFGRSAATRVVTGPVRRDGAGVGAAPVGAGPSTGRRRDDRTGAEPDAGLQENTQRGYVLIEA